MDEKIDKALETLLDQVRTNLKPAEALQQAEAVLKMVQAKQLHKEAIEGKPKKPGASAT